jgi:hypothetical protein
MICLHFSPMRQRGVRTEPAQTRSHPVEALDLFQGYRRQFTNIEVAPPPPFALPGLMHHKIAKRTQGGRRGNGKMSFLVFALAPANA